MALIDLDIAGSGVQTVDQSDYNDNDVLKVNLLTNNTSLTITNTTDSDEVLEIQQAINAGVAGTTTLTLDGSNVKVAGLAGVVAGSTYNYNLSNGATLDLKPASLLGVDVGKTVNVDMGSSSSTTLKFDPPAINLGLGNSFNITGLSGGDQIQVAGADSAVYQDGKLIFQSTGLFGIKTTVASFEAPGHEASDFVIDGGSVTFACYLKGTHIATPEGEVKVETLKAGDKVLTASGNVATVKWLGFRKLNRDRIPASAQLRAAPIRIAKGALAENVPHRDLTVSPGHRFNFDGALVPALSLVNGLTITQDFSIKHYEYFHVELEKFDMLLAEGAAAESYLDVGDYRNAFENAETVAAHPDFGPAPERVALPGYVQKITPEIIQPIRRALFDRAQALTGATRSADANLRVEANGVVIASLTPCSKRGVYRFELPAGLQSDIRIVSNTTVVRDTSLNSRRDTRVIGVGLTDISLTVDGERQVIDITNENLTGLNAVQDVYGTNMRWTTGEAVIPANLVPSSKGSVVLELTVLRTHMYWTTSEQEKARKAA
ncbi:MAG: Hint domain-containing protein [Advenella sp.]